ncbi:SH3 domain-containing C40 family peptidase [Cellulosilyticum sp. ST5]|uniref:C40 family peptidase n=1 Tax=Cellulosilyticum sp. ST5 TaxID=3055805 RepID=UPI0039773AF1
MKKIIKAVCLIGILWGTLIPVYATTTAKNNIFPSYTGVTAQLVGNEINVRNYPSKYGKVLMLANAQELHILGQNDKWYRVSVKGEEGWVSKDFVEVPDDSFIPYSKVLGEEIVDYGKLFIGTPYVWGGNDLRSGVDCSGLTQRVYAGFDIDISRVSYMQAKDGIPVTKSQLQPGDLVFFDTSGVNNGRISHVGIYAGNGQFLHADSTRGVMLSRLSSNYYTRNYVMGSRILHYF